MRLEGVSKTYLGNNEPAIKNLSLDVYDGEIVTLLGPSGCGKTTTLRMVAGLEVPDQGDIFFGDCAVVITSRRFLFPPDKRNIGNAHKFPRREIRERVRRALELVGMGGYENRPGPLLGRGQQLASTNLPT